MHIATVHDGKKPYACTNCDVSFSHKGYLNRHIVLVHEAKNITSAKLVVNVSRRKILWLTTLELFMRN